MQIDMVTNGKSLAHVLRANPGIILMLLRSIDMNVDIIGKDVKDPAPLRDLIKASTIVAVVRDMADTGAEAGSAPKLVEHVYNTVHGLFSGKKNY